MSEKLEILRKSLGNYYRNNSEYLFSCPKCNHHKKKLSVNIDKNVFKCWICEYTGKDIRALLKKYSTYELLLEWNNINGTVDLSKYDTLFEEDTLPEPTLKVELPEGFKTLTGPLTKIKQKPLKYLYSRGFDYSDILRWKIGFCDFGPYEGRIIVPSFNSDGDLNYYVARTYLSNGSYKYKNPDISKDVIFNDINIDWSKDIILCEGVFDAMKCDNSIPLLGSSIKETSKLFQKICRHSPRVFLALDQDAKSKEFYIMKKFRDYGINTYSLNIHPYSDLGEMPKKEIENRKMSAEFMTEVDYLHYKLNF